MAPPGKIGRRPRSPDEGLSPALDPWIVGGLEVAVLRVALVNASLRSAACDRGVGRRMPLGLPMVGTLRGRAAVTRIDAAHDRLTDADIVRRVAARAADVAMVAHVGSTQAHPCCLRTMAALKAALPGIVTVYGVVHPTYHAADILAHHPEVDVIVRGEGEATAAELVEAPALRGPSAGAPSGVAGIARRRGGQVVLNRILPPPSGQARRRPRGRPTWALPWRARQSVTMATPREKGRAAGPRGGTRRPRDRAGGPTADFGVSFRVAGRGPASACRRG